MTVEYLRLHVAKTAMPLSHNDINFWFMQP